MSWISVEMQEPPIDMEVIAHHYTGRIYVCTWDGADWIGDNGNYMNKSAITHWMLIPNLINE
jgi:hypothetical protein